MYRPQLVACTKMMSTQIMLCSGFGVRESEMDCERLREFLLCETFVERKKKKFIEKIFLNRDELLNAFFSLMYIWMVLVITFIYMKTHV